VPGDDFASWNVRNTIATMAKAAMPRASVLPSSRVEKRLVANLIVNHLHNQSHDAEMIDRVPVRAGQLDVAEA